MVQEGDWGMHIDRRSFLRAATASAVAGYVPLRSLGIAGAAEKAQQTMAGFTKHVSTPFRFTVGSRVVTMPLTGVTDDRSAGARATPGSGESFSLMFAGALPAFAQGTYPVEHAAYGRLTMFVVPVGRRPNGQDYQVAFNRCMV